MKKLFRNLAVVILTVCAVFACAFAVSACSKNTYTFVIQYEDGTAVNGQTGGSDGGKVMTQICKNEENGEKGKCVLLSLKEIFPDENGKLTLTQDKVNELFNSETDVTEFSFHVTYVPGYKTDCEFEVSGAKEYTCKLYK